MKTGDIVRYVLIAAGAYLVWVYVVEPLMAGTAGGVVPVPVGVGVPTNTNTGVVGTIPNLPPAVVQVGTGNPSITQPPATPPQPPQTTMTAATALANALVQAAGVNSLNPDQWSYYYAMLPGRTAIPASTFNSMLAAGGITDRSQPIPVGAFVIMLASSGLGDIVPVNGSMIGLGGGNTGFRKKKTNGFGGNPQRMTVQ